MKRNNRRQMPQNSQFSQILNDLTSALTFIFVALLVIALLIINPVAVTQVPEFEALQVTTEWDSCLEGDREPGLSRADVDTWIMGTFYGANGQKTTDILGYSTRDRKTKYFILDQDDKGYRPPYPNSPLKEEEQLNKEVIKSAKSTLTDGYYDINLHLFADKGELRTLSSICVDVTVVVFKGDKSREKVVCQFTAEKNNPAILFNNRQERTVCQFEIRNGLFVEGSNEDIIQKPFINRR